MAKKNQMKKSCKVSKLKSDNFAANKVAILLTISLYQWSLFFRINFNSIKYECMYVSLDVSHVVQLSTIQKFISVL